MATSILTIGNKRSYGELTLSLWFKFNWIKLNSLRRRAIKRVVRIPTLAGGDLRHPDFCERLREQGKADFIGLARPLFADPEWPRKVREGRVEDIRLCISCNECFTGSGARRRGGGARRCAVNAAAGRESEFAEIIPAAKAKKVMVIGGGPAGMEAARVAALRGHSVTLYERGRELGGQLLLAGKPQDERTVLWLRDYLATQLNKLGVNVELGVEVTPRLVEEAQPDVVVVATGAEPVLPDIPGISCSKVITGWHLLRERARPVKERVAVVGGGSIGCEVAEYLLELENKVTIIEQMPSVAPDMEPFHRFYLLEFFKEKGVSIFTRQKAVGVTEKGVQVANLDNDQEEFIETDWVVIAVGTKPEDKLVGALEGKVPELFSVGDCNRPRVIIEAVYEGSLVGRQIL